MDPMLTALGELFEEDLVPGIEDRLTDIDKTYSMIVTSSERVEQDSVTQDYKVLHTFCRSMAGALRYGSPLGPNMRDNTGATKLINAHDSYPAVGDIALPNIQRRYIQLGKLRGNCTMSTAMARANKLHTVGDYPALVLQQTAKLVAHQTAVGWYLNDSAQAVRLDCDGDTTGVVSVANTYVVTFTKEAGNDSVIGEGRARRLQPGLQYDVWSTDAAAMDTCWTQNGWAMITENIDMYDPTTLTMFFQSAADAADIDEEEGDFYLVPYGAIPDRTSSGDGESIAPCGYQWWLRESGTLYGNFGDLTITSYGSMFKSLVAALSDNLTEAVLTKYINTFEEATGVGLDTIMVTQGILTDMLATYGADGSSTLVRVNRNQDAAASIKLGWTDLVFAPGNGKELVVNASAFLNSGEAVVLQSRDGNLIRYRPPKVDSTDASVAGFDPGIEWLSKIYNDTIWMPSVASGGGRTDGMEAPFDIVTQNAAEEMRGIRLTGVTEITA